MAPDILELRGNLRVDIFDQLGGQLLGRAMLLIEPAPNEGRVERARLEPGAELVLHAGPHYLRLPSGEGWQVELRALRAGEVDSFGVMAAATPMSAAVGGE